MVEGTAAERQTLLRTTNKDDHDDDDDGQNVGRRVSWKIGMTLTALLVVVVLVVRDYQPNVTIDADLKAENLEEALNAAEPIFYRQQLVDHHNDDDAPSSSQYYEQRYYEKKKYFGGPGSPIFVILGGEDELDGLLYPWIHEHLARDYRAVTFALEHRFFGQSWPVPQHRVSNDDLARLLNPDQALWDAVRFIQHQRTVLDCSLDRRDVAYCPVMTVGGSYPGFLSALMRFAHADVVDIGYAASAPLNLYSHHVDPDAYYEKVTHEAERASPGCSAAVRDALRSIRDDLYDPATHDDDDGRLDDDRKSMLSARYGLCRGSIPDYIQDTRTLADELIFVVATHFAEYNMMYYPPGPTRDLVKACRIFQQGQPDQQSRHHRHRHHSTESPPPQPGTILAEFLAMGDDADTGVQSCYDLKGKELPDGANATITGSDWSGIGSGDASIFWEFLSCQLLSPTGFSDSSMFPERQWSFDWERRHCYDRFQYNIDPDGLEDEFHFDERDHVTHLLLTNGLVDGWSLSSILQSDAPGVTVINMENGAHHSDLDHHGPTDNDTEDVKAAFVEIRMVIGQWLDEIRSTNT